MTLREWIWVLMESNSGFNDLIGEVYRGNLTVFKGGEVLCNRYHNKTYLEPNLNPSLNQITIRDTDSKQNAFGIISLAQKSFFCCHHLV
jgi:hypothetical protein